MPISPFDILSELPEDGMLGLFELHDRVTNHISNGSAEDQKVLHELYIRAVSQWVSESVDLEQYQKELVFNTDEIPPRKIQEAYNELNRRVSSLRNRLNEIDRQKRFKEEIDAAIRQSKPTYGFTRLSPDEKQEAHTHLNKCREIIEGANLDDRKRNDLLKHLNKLAAEIDKAGTSTEGFMNFLLESSLTAGKIGENAAPLLKEVKELVKTIAKARARDENVELPSGEDISLITDLSEDINGE